jgi:hypothetical protein
MNFILKFVGKMFCKDMIKNHLAAILPVTLAITFACVVFGLVSVKIFGPDNQVEKIAEKVIQKETGIEVDFSPKKEEKAKEQPKAKRSFFKKRLAAVVE